jgi:PKD repeat protein
MAQRRLFLIVLIALLGAAFGFGGVLQSCQAPNKAPFARFTFSPKEPKVGESVTFDASQSSDPDGKIISYFWDFADGETAQGVTTTHAFKKAGEYDVILQVTDDRGANTTLAKTVRVVPPNQPPVAIFTVEPLEPTANQEVTFDASAAADPRRHDRLIQLGLRRCYDRPGQDRQAPLQSRGHLQSHAHRHR